jgi:drug/metabolite transporter (DMT)-like permease
MSPDMLAMSFGISSALAWGAGDFSGGFASRRCHVLTVVLFSQIVGAIFLLMIALLFKERFPPFYHMVWGALAGIFGVLGLLALYRGLATGRMGIVAPLSAVITAVIPIVFAFFNEGFPKITQVSGFGVVLLAVWLLSYSKSESKLQRSELVLPVLAGIGFGLFFICIDRASTHSVLWPLVGTRFGSITLTAMLYMLNGKPPVTQNKHFFYIFLAGIFDIMGNGFFAVAAHLGRLDISAILSSLYPAVTVILAWLILKEKLLRQQWLGVLSALLALGLIAF